MTPILERDLLDGVENGTDPGTWFTDGNSVARSFHGQYTIAEINSLLADMQIVQNNVQIDRLGRVPEGC